MKQIDQGVFLHRSPYSDSSLIATFYTRKNGLQKFMFKGGKKKAHGIYPLSISDLTYYGKNSELMNLTNVDVTYPHTFQFDPIRSSIAFFVAEVILKCVHAGDVDNRMFEFFEQLINDLNYSDDVRDIPLQFLIDYSNILGFKPYQENDGTFFNLDAGVFQSSESKGDRVVSGDAVGLILNKINHSLKGYGTKSTRSEALAILLNYYSIHVPGFVRLESYEIIKEVLRS